MKTIFSVLFAAMLLVATPSHAVLIMHVDTVNKQFAFSGTESAVAWTNGGYLSENDIQTSPADYVLWNYTILEISGSPSWSGQFGYNSYGGGMIIGTLENLIASYPNSVTITGTELFVSYASLDATSQTKLENLATNEGTLEWSGISADDVQVTTEAIPGPVPEPSQVILMISGLALLGSLRFRAKRHA